ncbi:MAG: hypothetical protein HOW73_26660 [Polyangiaceae bacterium]|nr:hypothetical protein [Polyangiaceae bacterium]
MRLLLLGGALLALSASFIGCNEQKKDDDKADEEKGEKKSKKDKKEKKDKASASSEATASSPPAKDAPPAQTQTAAATATVIDAPPPVPPGTIDVTKPNIGTPEKPVTSPTQQSYAMGTIKPVADSCANAHVILTQAPESVGLDYDWKYSRQAMLANQQYRVVDGTPTGTGQVSFQVHQADASMNKAFVLVANCADGVTCNHLAAMYKAIVKSSNPQVICGDLPAYLGPKKKSINLMAGGPNANLPAASDTISKCARMAACTIADKTDTTDDVGINCQKSPQSFKLECASRYPCAEVLACAK